jgi:hypothetical protein
VVNAVANSNMRRARFVRHFVRHRGCSYDKRLDFNVLVKEMAHSRGFEPLTSAFGGQRAYKPATTGCSFL